MGEGRQGDNQDGHWLDWGQAVSALRNQSIELRVSAKNLQELADPKNLHIKSLQATLIHMNHVLIGLPD
jgi:hypothetical protein